MEICNLQQRFLPALQCCFVLSVASLAKIQDLQMFVKPKAAAAALLALTHE